MYSHNQGTSADVLAIIFHSFPMGNWPTSAQHTTSIWVIGRMNTKRNSMLMQNYNLVI